MSIQNFYEHAPKNGKPEQIVILLHGLGSNGRDLISLASYWAENLPQAVFISPDAPFSCDMMPPGYPDSFQWFSLKTFDPHAMLNGAKDVFPIVEEFITAQLRRFGLMHDKLALAGFSQGTMTSLYVATHLPEKIAGVLGYSGALLWDEEVTHKPPVHLVHGMMDTVVPVHAWYHAREVLLQNEFEVTGHTTPGLMHSIDMDGIRSGGAFLVKALKGGL